MSHITVEFTKKITTKKQAVAITHTLSNPDKMPCRGYSTPANNCQTGAKLRKIKGSVCYNCYAMKGCYVFPVVKSALEKRLNSISHPQWVEAMTVNIKRSEFFRWHDSGDLQGDSHLIDIFTICNNTPSTSHWLPTKEKAIVRRVLKSNKLPANLIIRYSMPMVNDKPRNIGANIHTSTSVKTASNKTGHLCIAYRTLKNGKQLTQKAFNKLEKCHGLDLGHCGDCRACWNKRVKNVSYLMH